MRTIHKIPTPYTQPLAQITELRIRKTLKTLQNITPCALYEDFLYLHLHTATLGEVKMLFMQISKHSPESCPLHNEAVKKASVDLMAKMDQLTKKHGIKVIGGWNALDDHSIVVVYDVPSLEAVLNFSMEPEVMIWSSYHTTETKMVMTLEESMKMLP